VFAAVVVIDGGPVRTHPGGNVVDAGGAEALLLEHGGGGVEEALATLLVTDVGIAPGAAAPLRDRLGPDVGDHAILTARVLWHGPTLNAGVIPVGARAAPTAPMPPATGEPFRFRQLLC
jgi:hypothetical protein